MLKSDLQRLRQILDPELVRELSKRHPVFTREGVDLTIRVHVEEIGSDGERDEMHGGLRRGKNAERGLPIGQLQIRRMNRVVEIALVQDVVQNIQPVVEEFPSTRHILKLAVRERQSEPLPALRRQP